MNRWNLLVLPSLATASFAVPATAQNRRSVRNAATSAKRRSNGLYASRRTAPSRPRREPWRRPIAVADSGVAIGLGERDAAAT
jgi:hypothetical protein